MTVGRIRIGVLILELGFSFRFCFLLLYMTGRRRLRWRMKGLFISNLLFCYLHVFLGITVGFHAWHDLRLLYLVLIREP